MEEIMMLVSMFIIIMTVFKLIFCELDGRRARKHNNVKWFLVLNGPFRYNRGHIMIVFFIFIALFQGISTLFTADGLLNMGLIVVSGMIGDIVSQFIYHYFGRYRFKAGIRQAIMIKAEIDGIKEKLDYELVTETEPFYDFKAITQQYIQYEDHVAFSTVDGGEFVSKLDPIPRISYVIDLFKEKAEERFADGGVTVTTFTNDGRLPFKDEKIDEYVCMDTNFYPHDVRRILKPEGVFIVCQKGTDHLKEYKPLFAPVILANARWDVQTCMSRLRDGRFEILDYDEYFGKVRYKSLAAIITHLRELDPEKVTNSDFYLNQYAYMLNEIKKNEVFEVTTHRFYVVARKKG